jgi:hypothetical protein
VNAGRNSWSTDGYVALKHMYSVNRYVDCVEVRMKNVISIVAYLINTLLGNSSVNTICACNSRASCVFRASGSLAYDR